MDNRERFNRAINLSKKRLKSMQRLKIDIDRKRELLKRSYEFMMDCDRAPLYLCEEIKKEIGCLD